MMNSGKDAFDLGIFVSDINASLEFYQKTLGMEKEDEIKFPGMGLMHRLKFGNGFFKLIDPENVPPAGPSGFTDQLGFRYVTFQVTNITELCEELNKKGVTFTYPETEIRPGTRIAMIQDPDGNTVELLQRDE